jgi:hypothetical protein
MKVIAKKIEMIAYFKEDGSIIPIKFKIEEEVPKVIKINKIVSITTERFCGNKMLVFTCISIINSLEKILEIKYDVEKCSWILYKI